MARIKICGLRRTQDIDYVNELRPDYIGFILTPGYRRSIDYDTARLLRSRLADGITVVGVFVDPRIDDVQPYLRDGIIDMVQLHGHESPQFCADIAAPVIKCFRPDGYDTIGEYDVDYVMFDSGAGSGRVLDWSAIPATDKPLFLAGGIDADNIRLAIDRVNPYCIDLSSSVETDGVKDYNKIKQILECVR